MPSIVLSNTHKTGQAENKETFNAMLKQQPLPFYIEYKSRGHRYRQPIKHNIVYKRLTPIGDTDMWNLFTSAWLKGTKNRFNVDFKLYDNYSDALFDKNSWSSCNFNDDIPPENRVGFPRDCGKNNAVGDRWIRRAQCDMKINGPCQGYPHMANKDWFDDDDHGGPTPTTSAACEARKQSWIGSCQNSDIEMRHRSGIRHYGWGNWTLTLYPNPFKKSSAEETNERIANTMSALDTKVEGFETDIDPFDGSLSFDDFKRHFQDIKESLERSSQGNLAAHMGPYNIAHIQVLTQAIDQLQIVRDNMQYIKDGCMPIFQEVMVKRLRLFYNGSGTTESATSELSGRNWGEEVSIMSNKFHQSGTILWNLRNYESPLTFELASDEPTFDLYQVTHNGSRQYSNWNDPNMPSVWKCVWFTHYLLVWCKYFTENQMNIDKFVHGFYDHLEIYNNTNFGFFKNNASMEAISSNKNYDPNNIYNVTYLSGTRWVNIIQFIRLSTQKVQFDRTTQHSIFGIDFTVFSDYLFHNCYNSTVFSPVDQYTINHIRQHYTGVTRKEGFLDYFARWYNSQSEYRTKYMEELYPAVNELKSSCMPSLNDDRPYWEILHSFNHKVNHASHSNTSGAILSSVRSQPIARALRTRAREVNRNISKPRQARVFSLFCKDIVENQNRMDGNIKNRRHMKDFYNKVGFIGLKMNDYMGAAFLSKYSDLVQKARVDSGEVMGSDAYITTNETSPNSDGVPVSLRESFASSTNNIFPSTEMYLGNLDMRVLNDGYVYKIGDKPYNSLSAYLGSDGMNHAASFKSDENNFIQCDNADNTPTGADLTFYCGGEEISQATYDYKYNALTEKCNDPDPDIGFTGPPPKIYTLTLVYEYSGSASSTEVKLVSSDGTNSSEYSLNGSIPNHDDIMLFEGTIDMTNNTKYQDSLVTNEASGNIELLKANTDTYLKGKDTTGNTMVLLYINSSGKLTMRFNLKPYRELTAGSSTKYHGNYTGSDKNVINVYNASDDKYEVGKNMKKNGYVGYDGVFYPHNYAGDVGKLGDKYEQISGICYNDGTNTIVNTASATGESECNAADPACIGSFVTTTGYIHINEDNKKYLYKCGGSSDANTGTYYHRKYTTNSDNLACLRDAEDTELISYADHSDLTNNTSSSFDAASHCGYNQLLEGLKADLDSKKGDMDTAFSNLLVEFNSMSADELSWLQKTDSGLNEFKTIVDEHRKLRTEMEGASSKQKLSQAQNRDNKNALETIEYKMAIAGIASICGVITLFQFMKK